MLVSVRTKLSNKIASSSTNLKQFNSLSNTSRTLGIITEDYDYYYEKIRELNEHAYFELVSRVTLLGLSILFLIIFAIGSLKPLGNYANDGCKFGRDFFKEKLLHSNKKKKSMSDRLEKMSISVTSFGTIDTIDANQIENKQKQQTIKIKKKTKSKKNCCCCRSCCCFCWRPLSKLFETMWAHFLPISHFCHLISIMLLIFSKIIFAESTSSLYSLAERCFEQSKSVFIPCLIDFYVTLARNSSLVINDELPWVWNNSAATSFILVQFIEYKFEILSFGLACASLFIRYGAVYWFTNKSLSFLITFIGKIISFANSL
jgi:hypothetical protein